MVRTSLRFSVWGLQSEAWTPIISPQLRRCWGAEPGGGAGEERAALPAASAEEHVLAGANIPASQPCMFDVL